MTITAHKSKDGLSVVATLDGATLTVPLEVEKTFLRDPVTDEVTANFIWTSPNRHRQMVADEYENKGIPLPDYPITLDERKADKVAALKAAHAAKERAGYSHDFGAPYGVQTLQLRNETDRTNWLTVKAGCSEAVLAGLGAQAGPSIRTAENDVIPTTYAAANDMLNAMSAWAQGLAVTAWTRIDQARAATTRAELDAISEVF